ncbi:MAG: hypothetical protein ACP5VS_06400 [Desulfomonilaceae bacterium]
MKDIPNFCVVVGTNRSRESTLFYLVRFLRDAQGKPWHFLNFLSRAGAAITNKTESVEKRLFAVDPLGRANQR